MQLYKKKITNPKYVLWGGIYTKRDTKYLDDELLTHNFFSPTLKEQPMKK